MNKQDIKEGWDKGVKFLSSKKVAFIITAVLLILIIAGSSYIRTTNISSLKDVNTGEYLTADLDAFYFLRIAETLIETGGNLPAYDAMRYPSLHLPFSNEMLPYALVFLFKVLSPISDKITLRFVDAIYPVIFFALGMIVFFFLILKLTKSKIAALLSSFLLAIIPAYLFRTMAGVSDHEPLGIFAFFLVLLSFAISVEKIEKKSQIKFPLIFGLITGFLTTFCIIAWGGISKFIVLIIPLSILIFWMVKSRENENKNILKNYLIFYSTWVISFIVFGFVYSYPIRNILGLILNLHGVIVILALIFFAVDYSLIFLKNNWIRKLGKYKPLFSLILSIIVLSILGLFLKNEIGLSIGGIISSILRPFGGGRIGSTVAENAFPYTQEIIGQIGKTIFWLFFAGLLLLGVEFSKGIEKKKDRFSFSFFWILMICGILFHRYSAVSVFNGDSFISQLFFIGSIFLFLLNFVLIYFRNKIEVKSNEVILLLFSFFMALAGITAVRLIFILTPVVCILAAYFILKLYKYAKNAKDDLIKVLLYISVLAIIVLLVFTSFTYIKAIKAQAVQIGPSSNIQWQNAMKWVRENTPENSIFVHWWDYGYWVQYLGERPTVTDGGHGNDYWDHLIGRYLLTTSNPNTALSFMKTQNVSYILVDPSDIGKYSAYSSIGSDEKNNDRYSFIPVMVSDSSQIQETKNGTARVYNGGFGIDEDILYEQNGSDIFIPVQNSGLGGIIIQEGNNEFQQPIGAYIYNNNQINIPLRYLYYNGKLHDFKTGLNAGIYIIPSINQVSNGIQVDNLGALMYFSPRTINTLVTKLYLMNDPLKEYSGVILSHSEPDPLEPIIELYSGQQINEFFYFSGLRGPLKIWEVNPSENILIREEFSMTSGGYAQLDNLTFVK